MGACDWGWVDTRMTEARSAMSVPFGWQQVVDRVEEFHALFDSMAMEGIEVEKLQSNRIWHVQDKKINYTHGAFFDCFKAI